MSLFGRGFGEMGFVFTDKAGAMDMFNQKQEYYISPYISLSLEL